MTAGRRRSYLDADVEQEIRLLALQDANAPEIRRTLEQNAKIKDRLPTERTIYRIVREMRPADPSGPWSPATADPQEAALVLDVLRAAIIETQGRTQGFTNAEAEQVVRLRTMRPDLPAYEAFILARDYLARRANQQPTDDLDSYLVFAPWQGPDAAEAYADAIAQGWAQPIAYGFVHYPDGTVKGVSRAEFQDALASALERAGWVKQGNRWVDPSAKRE